ncbi:MAG: ABC transporter substrate-binding protein [Eubacteriales bacterium]
MKRKLALTMTLMMIVMSVVGCGGTDGDTVADAGNAETTVIEDATTNELDDVNGEKTVVELWHYWGNESQQELLDKYVGEFNAQSETVEIEYAYIPYAEFTQKVLVSAAGGKVPDILVYGNNETAILAEAGVLGEITDIVMEGGYEERFVSGLMDSHVYNDEYYGLPIYGNCLALFYNKELITTPPTTWDELMTIAEEVTTDDCYALAISAVESEEGVFQFLPWLWSAGADLDSLDSEEGIASLQMLKDLVDLGYMSKEVVSWAQQDAQVAFSAGRAAMMVNGPWMIPEIEAAAPDLDYGVTVLPALDDEHASILGGESFGVAKGGQVDKAAEFFEWIYSEEIYAQFVQDLGQLPADEELLMESLYQDDPIQKAFVDNLLVAKPRAYGPDYNEMSKAIQTALTATLTGSKTAEEALVEAASIVEPLLP